MLKQVQHDRHPELVSESLNARDLPEEIRKENLSHGLDFANAKSGKLKDGKQNKDI